MITESPTLWLPALGWRASLEANLTLGEGGDQGFSHELHGETCRPVSLKMVWGGPLETQLWDDLGPTATGQVCHPDPVQTSLAPHPPAILLTLHFEVHGLGVLADGVAGSADVLPGVCVLDALQGQGRHAGVAAHHHVPVQGLPGGEGQRQGLR